MNAQRRSALDQELSHLVCVTAPYNALRNIEATSDDGVRCDVTVEHTAHGEATLISGAEAGRHLAILGSYALARQNPLRSKHFYLATEATLRRRGAPLAAPCATASALVSSARVTAFDKRTGEVSAEVGTRDGEAIFAIDVRYSVLRAELFERLFRKARRDDPRPAGDNPYARPAPLAVTRRERHELRASLGTIEASQCVGHFDHYPALPVAVLSGSLARLAAAHLGVLAPQRAPRYAIRWTRVVASRLAFAGERIDLCSALLREASDACGFRVTARDEAGAPVGEIEIEYELLS